MAGTHEEVLLRVDELIAEGSRWAASGDRYHAAGGMLGWITAAANLVAIATGGHGTYHERLQSEAASDVKLKSRTEVVLGLLTSFRIDFERGLVRGLEYPIAAETFDEFLDHARRFARDRKPMEAAILVSAVFEDAARRLAKKHGRDRSKPMEQLIDDLALQGIISLVAARRFKGASALRNKALHADWDAFNLRDVDEVIATTGQVVELVDA